MQIQTGLNGDGSPHYEEVAGAEVTTTQVGGTTVNTITATPGTTLVFGPGVTFGISNA